MGSRRLCGTAHKTMARYEGASTGPATRSQTGCLGESKAPADTVPAGTSLESAAPEKKADNESGRGRNSYGFPGVLPNVLLGGTCGVPGLFRNRDSNIVES